MTTSIDRLSSLDKLMLWASKRWPQDIAALVYLDGEALIDPAGRFGIEVVRTDIPEHPEIWDELCGHYRFPAKISDLRGRLALAAGVEVFVRDGHLMIRALVPVPALYRGLVLHPDDEDDPTVFRLDPPSPGMSTVRVVFGRDAATGRPAIHADLGGQPLTLVRTGRDRAGPSEASER